MIETKSNNHHPFNKSRSRNRRTIILYKAFSFGFLLQSSQTANAFSLKSRTSSIPSTSSTTYNKHSIDPFATTTADNDDTTDCDTSISRRSILLKLPISIATTLLLTTTTITTPFTPPSTYIANAKPPPTENPDQLIFTINEASETLDKLLSNWEKATIDCTYADIPRELLEQKNKDLLLEKASTFALFDKTTSVTSCKKTNRIVRDYIGVTGKGPLVNIDKKMLKRVVVDQLDPDVLDEYYVQVENFQNAISRAASLSYAAGVADFDSVNNFDKESLGNKNNYGDGDNSNLEQAKKAIGEAKVCIDLIVSFLPVIDAPNS